MNISLPDLITEFVDKQVRYGGFGTAGEHVSELVLRDQKACSEARLESLLLEGMESGEPIPWNAEYRETLRDELRDRRKQKA